MMLYPSIGDLMEKAGDKYSLVIATSKRARQIADQSDNDDKETDGAKSISLAIQDIADGKVKIVKYD